MSTVVTVPNPELVVTPGNKSYMSHADNRRWGFHNLHRIARYSLSLRAHRVMVLEKNMSLQIAEMESVRRLTSLPWFSGMVVIRGSEILFERYAGDFGPDRPHSIQSISKTTMHLVIGMLMERGDLDLSHSIDTYLPEIGTGYAGATIQQVLNMDIVNDYSEDFANPRASIYGHEEAMGWRLPPDGDVEQTQHDFIARIGSQEIVNRTGEVQYKDANTDVLGWVAERASGRPLRALLADVVDASGLEGVFHITTDREGTPAVDGGVCVTARDLARYFSIFVRRGRGIQNEIIGSASLLDGSLAGGTPMNYPFCGIRYSNHLMISGSSIGHGGWGGQYAMANLDTGVVGIFFSVIENEHAINRDYLGPVVAMLDAVTAAQ